MFKPTLPFILFSAMLLLLPCMAARAEVNEAKPAYPPSQADPEAHESAPKPSKRLTVAILPSQKGAHAGLTYELYKRLITRVERLGRYEVLPRPAVDPFVTELPAAPDGSEQSPRISRKLPAQKLFVVEMTSDLRPLSSSDSSSKKQTYESMGFAHVRYVDLASGVPDEVFDVSDYKSADTANAAEMGALDALALDILIQIRERTKLETHITTRSGRHLELDLGSDEGVSPGMYFEARGPQGEPRGLLQVVSVSGTSAEARLTKGYYTVEPGLRAVESVMALPTLAIGYSNRVVSGGNGPGGGALMALSGRAEDVFAGWSLGGELGGWLLQQGVSGFGATAWLERGLEIIPERFWFFGTLGVAYDNMSAPIPGLTDFASDTGLHGLASLGATWRIVGGLEAQIEEGYMTPWTYRQWDRKVSDDQTISVKDPGMPTPSLGGWYSRFGLAWGF